MTVGEFTSVWWRELLLRVITEWISMLGVASLFGYLIPPHLALLWTVLHVALSHVLERNFHSRRARADATAPQ